MIWRPQGPSNDQIPLAPHSCTGRNPSIQAVAPGNAAAGEVSTLDVTMPDRGQELVIYVENGVINHTLGKHDNAADVTRILDGPVLDNINPGQTIIDRAIMEGKAKIESDTAKLERFFSLLDQFEFWFNIVTPR